jgi:hypothetical protein
MNAFKKNTAYYITVYYNDNSLFSDKYGDINYVVIKNISSKKVGEFIQYTGTDEDNNTRRFCSKWNIDYSEV